MTGFCTIRAFKERYLQSINSSKAFLLLNYFILLICLKKLFFRSISSVIVVFNNRNFMTCEKHYYFSEISNMKNNYLFTWTVNVIVLVFICFMFEAFLTKNIANIGLDWLFYLFYFSLFLYHFCLFICLIKISGNPEEIPGPKRYSAQYLNICHVNLSSTAVHNLMKVAL